MAANGRGNPRDKSFSISGHFRSPTDGCGATPESGQSVIGYALREIAFSLCAEKLPEV